MIRKFASFVSCWLAALFVRRLMNARVNPYTTLVSDYERLIRGRGREVGPDPGPMAAAAHALPDDVAHHLGTPEGVGN
ncbi:hypothetical protein [Bradyrhizobium lablabi]|uniref:hypothetical protein n=1 Tax=Bradyrhizobium lablabi TaxID=722472 RepID=UPI001BAD4225|nr:hypothetical protein [Bradyrhizobium lablabi]MBR0693032.1 hypothetical protein [Bradyrhizobium lablabi]